MLKKYMDRYGDEETLGRFILDVVVNSVIIIVLFLFVQKFLAAPFQVIGDSMVNTLHDGEYIIVTKLEYFLGEPERGDIIVFHPPQNKKEYYIKRIIGIPGDTVRLKAGEVYVNGQKINESYLPDNLLTCLVPYMRECRNDDKSYAVPENQYFVLGDNRNGSSDSRSWQNGDNKPDSFVDLPQIQGKARVVLFPPSAIRLIPKTGDFESLKEENTAPVALSPFVILSRRRASLDDVAKDLSVVKTQDPSLRSG